jgi:hypothetical protein
MFTSEKALPHLGPSITQISFPLRYILRWWHTGTEWG